MRRLEERFTELSVEDYKELEWSLPTEIVCVYVQGGGRGVRT